MINDNILKDLANKYGTPSYIFDADEVISRALEIKKLLGNVPLCFSIKANPFLIPILIDTVDLFEVCSPGELEICRHLAVPGNMIIYSGVNKGISDVTKAVDYNVNVLTAESIRHFELIEEATTSLGKKADVLLRLSSKSQFGMSLDDVKTILSKKAEHINIVGIHYFAGTQRTKLKHQREELEYLKDTIISLREEFIIELPRLEYGPGLAYPYFENDDFTDTLMPLKELAPDLNLDWCELSVEMGRFLASSCGYYLSSIVDLKKSYDHNWCILDGGLNHVNYLGQMMGMKLPVIKYFPTDSSISQDNDDNTWTLCGSLCTTNDVLVRSYEMSNPSLGDLLVFCNIGAYSVTEGIYLFLSRSLPKIIIYQDGKDTLIRDTIQSWEINVENF